MLNMTQFAGAVMALVALGACVAETKAPTANRSAALAEVQGRQVGFPLYPQTNRTYLSFDQAHGFQVNFISSGGDAWLWYPGNAASVPEEFKADKIREQRVLCWRHPSNSRNPVTNKSGGGFACEPLLFAKKRVVSELRGDPFRLASGAVPFRLSRCAAPKQFVFDRARFAC